MGMTREEAKAFLTDISYDLGTMGIEYLTEKDGEKMRDAIKTLEQEPKCKDCKWWKDSDGEYRRGCGAESICRINTDKVYQGEGYCYMFEPQESEK